MKKLFAVSVADAYLRDTTTDSLVVKGKALLSSSMEQTIQEQELFAGRGSQLQFTYNYQKVLAFQIEAADFSPVYLAIQSGSEIKNKLSKYFTDEKLEFDASGTATLTQTPVGSVYVELDAGNLTVIPTGNTISVPELKGQKAFVAYQYETTLEELTISADDFPSTYELFLTFDLYGQDKRKAYEVQIHVPSYSLDGATTLSLTHDGVSQFTMNGKALVDDEGNYAYIKFNPVSASDIKVTGLATTPAKVQLDHTDNSDSEKLKIVGVRPSPYSNVLIDNTKATFLSDDPTIAQVSADGTVTLGTSPTLATGDETNITITYDGQIDVVQVQIL